MTLQEQGEAHLIAGDYEQAIPPLVRSISTDRSDDFRVNAELAAWALMLAGEFSVAEIVLQEAITTSFATTSFHRSSVGWSYWFRGLRSIAVEWFWKAARAAYQSAEWQLSLHYASIREPGLVSRREFRDYFGARGRRPSQPPRDELKLQLALGQLSVRQFEQELRSLAERLDLHEQAATEVDLNLWVGLDLFRNGDEPGGIRRLLAASRPGRDLDSASAELILARLELQRLGLDPATGRPLSRRTGHTDVLVRVPEKIAQRTEAATSKGQRSPDGLRNSANRATGSKSKQTDAAKRGDSPRLPGHDLGGFLDLLGTVGSTVHLHHALRQVAKLRSANLTRVRHRRIPPEQSVLCGSAANRNCVLLPPHLGDVEGLARELSRELSGPVLLFHLHDGDFWMYALFDRGSLVDRFIPMPDYWPGKEKPTRSTATGSPKLLARLWPDVSEAEVRPYLKSWDQVQDRHGKAHQDDLYGFHDGRQIVDFLRRLGLWIPNRTPAPAGAVEAEFRWVPSP